MRDVDPEDEGLLLLPPMRDGASFRERLDCVLPLEGLERDGAPLRKLMIFCLTVDLFQNSFIVQIYIRYKSKLWTNRSLP
jgi:hypothetical protein